MWSGADRWGPPKEPGLYDLLLEAVYLSASVDESIMIRGPEVRLISGRLLTEGSGTLGEPGAFSFGWFMFSVDCVVEEKDSLWSRVWLLVHSSCPLWAYTCCCCVEH